jgi:transposase
LTETERERLAVGLRSQDLYAVRRCQILLASARGEWVPRIAELLGCNDQTVRNVLREFEQEGLDACLTRGSSRPHTIHAKVDAVAGEQLRALLHQSPRTFGKPTSVWTMELAAEVSFAEGITAERVSGETIRQAILRLGIRWQRAKQWITSPDPEYARKKVGATAWSAWPRAIRPGPWASRTRSGGAGWLGPASRPGPRQMTGCD